MSDFVQFDMAVVKTSVDPQSGERRIRLSASDTGKDFYDEAMSVELFKKFIERIQKPEQTPTVFRTILKEKSGWSGGMPYASISHYTSGVEGRNVPATITNVYLDGKVLKSVSVVPHTPLGDALWQALQDDKNGTSKFKDKIRISIGFLDLKHSHGNFIFTRDGLDKVCPMCKNNEGNKVYLDGILVHEAFTRKPANPRTDVEVMRMDEEIKTRAQDAASIVGDDLAEQLEVNKSTLELVEKAVPAEDSAKDEEMEGEHPADCVCEACAAKKKKSEVAPVEKSELEVAFEALTAEIVKNKSLPRDEALRNIQPTFDALGAAVQKSFVEPVTVAAPVAGVTATDLQELAGQIKGMFAELKSEIQMVSGEVSILKAQTSVTPTLKSAIPAPRTAQVDPAQLQSQLLERSAMSTQGRPLKIAELVQMTTKI